MLGVVADAGADCVVPELEPRPSRAGTSDDSLQAIVKPIRRMTIVMLERFTKNLLLLMSTLFDGHEIMHMPFAAQPVQLLVLIQKGPTSLIAWMLS